MKSLTIVTLIALGIIQGCSSQIKCPKLETLYIEHTELEPVKMEYEIYENNQSTFREIQKDNQ